MKRRLAEGLPYGWWKSDLAAVILAAAILSSLAMAILMRAL